MIITRIYKQKTGRGVNIEVDYEFLFSLKNPNSIVDARLYKGQELNKKIIKEALLIDLRNIVRNSALEKSFMSQNSSREIRRKLLEKAKKYIGTLIVNINIEVTEYESIVTSVIEEMTRKKYIDDQRSANSFVKGRIKYKPRGKNLLKQELHSKGFDSRHINSALESINENDLVANGIKLANKKRRLLKNLPKAEERQKIYTYLARKGYSSDIILRILEFVL